MAFGLWLFTVVAGLDAAWRTVAAALLFGVGGDVPFALFDLFVPLVSLARLTPLVLIDRRRRARQP